jgi:predicted deacetylase
VSDWLEPVVRALAAATGPVPWFFRDDDAGWADDALWALLDEFETAGVPIDVAAIPTALTPDAGRRLAARAAGGLVGVHQHGYAHVDHEPAGRKCEFGAARDAAAQAADVANGRALLEDALGRSIDPVFTPPWNRASADLAGAVLAAGHRVLSRDVSAGRLDGPGLAEVPVTVDWSARRRGVPVAPSARGQAIAAGVAGGGPVGVMLHHATLDATDRAELARLLAALRASGVVRSTRIVDLAITARG